MNNPSAFISRRSEAWLAPGGVVLEEDEHGFWVWYDLADGEKSPPFSTQ